MFYEILFLIPVFKEGGGGETLCMRPQGWHASTCRPVVAGDGGIRNSMTAIDQARVQPELWGSACKKEGGCWRDELVKTVLTT